MSSSHASKPGMSVRRIVGVLLVALSLCTAYAGAGLQSAYAASDGSPLIRIASSPDAQPGSGVVSVDLTIDLQPIDTSNMTITLSQGTFSDGSSTQSFIFHGSAGDILFTGAFQCAPAGTTATVHQDGSNMGITEVLNVGAGDVSANCGVVEPPAIDTDGDGVLDGIDRCNTPAGLPVNEVGCAVGLAPSVEFMGGTLAPSADGVGSASFSFTNNNDVTMTFQVHVSGVSVGTVTLDPRIATPWSVDRPVGDYALTLRAAGSVTNPVPFSIAAAAVVIPPVVEPTKDPKPVTEPTKDPKPVVKPTKDPKPTPSAPVTEKPVTQPQPTPASTEAAPAATQPASTEAPALATGQRGGSFPQSVDGVRVKNSHASGWLMASAVLIGALGFILLTMRTRKVARR